MKILDDKDADGDLNPVDRHYRQLNCDLRRLERDSDEFR